MYPSRTFSLRMPVGNVGQMTPAWDAIAIRNIGITNDDIKDGETLVYNETDNVWESQLPTKISVEATLDTSLSAVVYDSTTQSLKIIPNTLSLAEDLYVHLSDPQQTIQGDLTLEGSLSVENTVTSSIYVADTSSTAPTYTFENFPTSGLRLQESTPTSSVLSILVNGTEKLYLDNSNCLFQGRLRMTGDGAQSSPIITFNNDSDTGIYRIDSDALGISTGGLSRLRVSSIVQTDVPLRINGSIGTNIAYMRRIASSAPITLSSNDSGSVAMPLGVTVPSTAYDAYMTVEITAGSNHITTGFASKTTTQFTAMYHNAGSSSSTFVIHAYIIGY